MKKNLSILFIDIYRFITIVFLLVTDAEVDDIPANVRVVKMSLKDIKHLAEQELGMKIALDIPVKLCDYKPVYGVIFNQYLKGYDYWGSCDLDMIFGDLQKFTKFELYKYDKFLHQGHLALYRNNSTINSAYKLPGSYYTYKRVFSSNESFVFDEYNRINSIFYHNKLPIFDKTIFANINQSFTRFKCCHLRNYRKQLFYYEDMFLNGYVLNNIKRITCNTQVIYNYNMTNNYYWKDNEDKVNFMIENSTGIAKQILLECKKHSFQ